MFKFLSSSSSTKKPAPEVLARWGRNDPCWCGSGKKYKVCHLGKDQTKK